MRECNNNKRLIIHGGLNKAGSSYIQENLNRLARTPKSISDFDYPPPWAGSGNLGDFVLAIRSMDHRLAINLFAEIISHTDPKKPVLLSSEFFYHQWVKEDTRALMTSVFQEFGYHAVDVIFIFRNIFEHAISAYTHRCGMHPLPSFKDWIAGRVSETPPPNESGVRCYEFWREAELFCNAVTDNYYNVSTLQFNDLNLFPELIAATGMSTTYVPPNAEKINVSPTVSEAEICKYLKQTSPDLVTFIRDTFKHLDRSKKSRDQALKAKYNNLITIELKKEFKLIQQIETILGFSITTKPLEDSSNQSVDAIAIELSIDQFQSLIGALRRPYNKGEFLKYHIKPYTPKLARQLYRLGIKSLQKLNKSRHLRS